MMMADRCIIRASVTTGLEFLAAEEAAEKLAVTDVVEGRGFVSWEQDVSSTPQVLLTFSFSKV